MAIVRECTGHTCHSQHHVLWYFFRQPTTTVLLEFTYEFDIQEKACFSRSRGVEFNRPVQGRGSTCRFGARSEGGQRVRSINRIAPQGCHRYSRRGHDTIVLHPSHSTWEFYPNKILKNCPQNQNEYINWLHLIKYISNKLHPVEYTSNRRPPINPIKCLLSF